MLALPSFEFLCQSSKWLALPISWVVVDREKTGDGTMVGPAPLMWISPTEEGWVGAIGSISWTDRR